MNVFVGCMCIYDTYADTRNTMDAEQQWHDNGTSGVHCRYNTGFTANTCRKEELRDGQHSLAYAYARQLSSLLWWMNVLRGAPRHILSTLSSLEPLKEV